MFALLAEALRYPAPGQLDKLRAEMVQAAAGPTRQALAAFIEEAAALPLAEQEELYTRTLDLNPLVAPYVGYHVWGEGYQRGEFMARLNRELAQHAVATGGELPDHLLPILRYLEVAATPLPELRAVMGQAVRAMGSALKQTEPVNPYRHLLKAIELTVRQL